MYRYTLSVTSVHVSFDMGSKINETGAPRNTQKILAQRLSHRYLAALGTARSSERERRECYPNKRSSMAPKEMPPSTPASPTASQLLMCAEKHKKDSYLWTQRKQNDVWALVKVVRQQNTLLTVLDKSTSEKMEIDLVSEGRKILTATWTKLRGCDAL
jgi:hypothetical protein